MKDPLLVKMDVSRVVVGGGQIAGVEGILGTP